MKAGREHRVPLSDPAIEVLEWAREFGTEGFVFPGERAGAQLSNLSMLMVLRRMKVDAVVHGFRSSFRDWAGERTSYPREVIEIALAHVIQNKTEAAYARSDLFEKRRRLMADWAEFCSQVSSESAAATMIGIHGAILQNG
jgi:integrase